MGWRRHTPLPRHHYLAPEPAAPRNAVNTDRRARRSLGRTHAMAVLTDLANPKVILFYIAFVPQFVTTGPSDWPVSLQLLTLGGLFILIGLAVDASVGVLAGLVSERVLRRRNGQTWLQRTSAASYGGLAVVVIADNRISQ
ncbi:MAG: LysE family translocator [Nocardioidaceae bacterium]